MVTHLDCRPPAIDDPSGAVYKRSPIGAQKHYDPGDFLGVAGERERGLVFTVVIVAVVVASLVLGVGFFTELVGACQDSPEGTIWGIPYTCN